MKITPFHVREAATRQVPVVVNIPHCGIYVPEYIRAKFASARIRSLPMTEWYLHHLCDSLSTLGIATIHATYNRFVADIDSAGDLAQPGPAGVSPLVLLKTPEGEDIYLEPPTLLDRRMRRDLVYTPYHARLNELLQSRITRYGSVVLVDLHSFPTRAVSLDPAPAQVYLADDGGRANPGWLTGTVQHAFDHAGMEVARNRLLQGGYIVRHYGAMPRVSTLYVGLRFDLYLDEQQPDRPPSHAGFRAFQNVLSDVFAAIVAEVDSGSLRMNRAQRLGQRAL